MSDWNGRRVLVTGHTGFKGAWLSLMLVRRGAEVTGCSDAIPTTPALFELARLRDRIVDRRIDVRDDVAVRAVMAEARPDTVFHLAAQSLVRRSHTDPAMTWATNVLGTINVLEAVRATPSVERVVVATSDKCYENTGDGRHHREGDPLGGADPYSASKAAAELATAAWRASFLAGGPRVATVRAGNVIGAGDWASERLVPDAVRAAVSDDTLVVRNPAHVRPWQDVLDCLSGYLLVAERLAADDTASRPWNLGPEATEPWNVERVVRAIAEHWPGGLRWCVDGSVQPAEAPVLVLDAGAARAMLAWRPKLTVEQSVQRLVEWHVAVARGEDPVAVSDRYLDTYEAHS